MMFLTRVVPALIAASSFVQASAVVSRSNDGEGIFYDFVDELYKNNLTILADNYKRIGYGEGGRYIVDTLESGKELTILAPEDDAFDSDNKDLDPLVIEYSTLFGDIDNHFSTGEHYRRGHSQTRSTGRSTMSRSKGKNGKRSESESSPYDSPFQVQIIDQFKSYWKRWTEDLILIDRPVGDAKVVKRFSFKKLKVLVIDAVLTLPPKVSKLLCSPILKTAPKGLTKFAEALKKAGLDYVLDDKDELTLFAPVDECLDDLDKLEKDDLSSFLKNHFFFGKIVYSPLFPKICEAKAESGKELKFSYENDIHYVSCGKSKAVLLRKDVIPWNGVVHVIDRPLNCDYD
ncbi:unnamed protein product [Rhizoctonia solani]|uniref:FAS1 domain-containing protein n=1 Tax=Rhizoctonia solani TaxID=456999 RepID=A0A8H3E2Q4_9AGAM|nr:unnamed protein product [Rhizoctonia solani]